MELQSWYMHPASAGHERVTSVTLHNLCGGNSGSISAKGMQTRTLYYFAVRLLKQCLHSFRRTPIFDNAQGMLKCGTCLTDWFEILGRFGHEVLRSDCTKLAGLCKKHISLWKLHSGQNCKPKHHAWFEMTRRIPRDGNPMKYSTYMDESCNSLVAALARSCLPGTLAQNVLVKYILSRRLADLPF